MKISFRFMLGLTAVSACFPGVAFSEISTPPPSSAQTSVCAPRALDDASWDGLGVLIGGKGYAPTPMGQVHYRLMGPADGPVILLIHQTPWSMIQFADIQPCLAEMGIRSLAIDTPGYGMSDPPVGKPSIQAYADNIVPVLDHLKIGKVVVAGHHTGAAIAAAFAAHHSDHVNGMILHGAPNYNEAERAQRLALPHPDLTLKPDGSHLSQYYAKLFADQGIYARNLATVNWSTLSIFLAGANDVAHAAVYQNRMGDDLAKVGAPGLILSDGGDALHEIDQRTAKMKPNFSYQQFSTGKPHAMMMEPKRWSEIVSAFVKRANARP